MVCSFLNVGSYILFELMCVSVPLKVQVMRKRLACGSRTPCLRWYWLSMASTIAGTAFRWWSFGLQTDGLELRWDQSIRREVPMWFSTGGQKPQQVVFVGCPLVLLMGATRLLSCCP
ncbi:unnamed protein product [Haemonchus placei]|uniref:Secreted protein n=1 Tax=Haemonchus placei TaxID=6290 RepID=A0A0N4WF33_HAEPC|nr:unnamed protein product [Haemonchus placei]